MKNERQSNPGLAGLVRSDLMAKAEWLYGEVKGKTVLKALLTDGTLSMLLYRAMQASQKVEV